jgi:uncharacterized protein (TIGR02996 family)
VKEAFLEAIRESPDDDTPRLVYADWLDEHGESDRAEFIRAQCALARLQAGSPERSQLQKRADKLLRAHGQGWFGPLLKTFKKGVVVERGFLIEIRGRVDQVLHHRADIAAFAPVLQTLGVELGRRSTGLEGLLALDLTGRVRNLEFDRPNDQQLAAIARAPARGHLDRLAILTAELEQGEEPVLLLNDSPLVAAADRFDLAFGLYLHNDQPPNVATELEVPNNARVLKGLRLPNLRGFGFGGATEALAEQFAGLSWFGRLDWLNFQCAYLGDSAVRVFLTSPNLGNLTRLSLGENGDVTDASAELLAHSPKLGRLRELRLDWTGIGDAGALALAGSPFLPRDLRLAFPYGLSERVSLRLRERFGEPLDDAE